MTDRTTGDEPRRGDAIVVFIDEIVDTMVVHDAPFGSATEISLSLSSLGVDSFCSGQSVIITDGKTTRYTKWVIIGSTFDRDNETVRLKIETENMQAIEPQ